MLPIISGTIRSTVKLAEMDGRWQQKKKSGKLWEKEDLDPVAKQIMKYKEDLEQMRESKKLADISTKLKAGSSLTSEEIEYLQRNNPELYKEYEEIQNEKKAYERELENCKTKDDVEKLKLNKMGSLLAEAKSVMNNPNIPEGKKLGLMEKILKKTMGIQDVHMKFVKSARYLSLPTEEELAQEEKEKAERKEEAAEEIGEKAEENAELAEESGKDSGENEKSVISGDVPDTDSVYKDAVDTMHKIELPEIKNQADDNYEAVRTFIIDYIRENRSSGYGLEFLEDDFDEVKKHNKK